MWTAHLLLASGSPMCHQRRPPAALPRPFFCPSPIVAAVLTNEPSFPDMQEWMAAYKAHDFNSVPGIANARERPQCC